MNTNKYGLCVGDRVRVRRWDDMEAELGLDSRGDINAACGFIRIMSKFCGHTATISIIRNDYVAELEDGDDGLGWSEYLWSLDMLEPESHEATVFDEGDFLKLFECESGDIQ